MGKKAISDWELLNAVLIAQYIQAVPNGAAELPAITDMLRSRGYSFSDRKVKGLLNTLFWNGWLGRNKKKDRWLLTDLGKLQWARKARSYGLPDEPMERYDPDDREMCGAV